MSLVAKIYDYEPTARAFDQAPNTEATGQATAKATGIHKHEKKYCSAKDTLGMNTKHLLHAKP